MTKEEIAIFAALRTFSNNRTIITFIDGSERIGYFEGNLMYGSSYEENKWNFIVIPSYSEDLKSTTLDGNSFQSIRIIDVEFKIMLS